MVSSQWHYWHLGPHNSLFWRAVGCVASTHEMPVASPTHEDQTCLQTLWLWNSPGERVSRCCDCEIPPGAKINTGWEALIYSKVAKMFFLPFCHGCHIFNTLLLTAQYIVSLYVINILSSAALKVFFLYLVFRSLTRLCPGVVFWGSQSVLDLWIPVLQQIWKSLAIVSSKNFFLTNSVSSPFGTLIALCWIARYCCTGHWCSVQFFFSLSELHFR